MGMFDWVKFDGITFPFEERLYKDGSAFAGEEYQTKDFDSNMDYIVFHADGSVTRERHHWNDVEDKSEMITDIMGLPTKDTYHLYHMYERYDWVQRREMGMENSPSWWVDVWADVENHKVIQLRYRITYKTAYVKEEDPHFMEKIEDEGTVYVGETQQGMAQGTGTKNQE